MPLEIEVKLRVESHETVRAALLREGARRIGDFLETNWILDERQRGLLKRGCGLRVRAAVDQSSAGDTAANSECVLNPPHPALSPSGGEGEPLGQKGGQAAWLTYKGPRGDGPFKVREELEIELSDAERMVQILGLLGFAPVLHYQKRRESWRLATCRIELDEPPHIGKFVEIEGPDNDAIRQVQARLGLSSAAVEPATYVELLSAYCDQHGIADRTLMLQHR